jgi:pimeloyl-ACP methyl ester carboxylesterase
MMKRLLLILSFLLSMALFVQAQDITFVPFTDEAYGVQGLVPDAWEARGFGSYARAESANDITALFIQSAPIPADTLLNALKGQLGVDEIPESTEQIEGILTWDSRRLDTTIQGMDIAISLATAEVDNTTYLVLLQSLAEEHDALVESVFAPVVESVEPLLIVESTEEAPYPVEELTFTSGDISLSGTLTLPEGEGPFPAVVLLTGSGPQDRDESIAPLATIKPFRDIADYFARHGIATLRYDDRGVGESEGDFTTATLSDFAADASAAVDFLAAREEVSAIGVVGHSEGGMIAPFVATTNENVDFVIGLAAPAVDFADVMLQQNRRIYETLGVSDEDIDAIVAEASTGFDAVQAGDDEALLESTARLIVLQGAEATDDFVQAGANQIKSFHDIGYFDWDTPSYWSEVQQPILAIYGDLDVQVDSAQNAPALEEITAANEDVTLVVFPTMNHILQEAETGGLGEYGTLEQSVREDLLETMRDWILERF